MLAFFLDHFWHFFFWGPGKPVWYERSVWGNVVATIPLAVMGAAAFFWHRGVVRRLHEKIDRHEAALKGHIEGQAEHGRKLLLILDALDPGTDGGITEIHNAIGKIADEINPDTPGGLRLVLDRLDGLSKT